MSLASLIAKMGKTVAIRRPTFARDSVGVAARTWTTAKTTVAFIQERSSYEQVAQGRDTRRGTTVVYFEGVVDVRTEDEIAYPATGSTHLYRVTGVRVPDLADQHPQVHTIVDAVKIEPVETI